MRSTFLTLTNLSVLIVVLASPAYCASLYLGTANSFGLLGGTVSNTGTSTVTGNVGALTAVTGFPPGVASGAVFLPGDPAVAAAFTDFETAYTLASAESSTASVAGLTTSQIFSGAGVYAFSSTDVTSAAGISLTFDAQSDVNAVFTMQIAGALTIDGPITFNLINGAQAGNIYWVVGTSATINPSGPPITWDGDLLAGTFTMSANTGGSGVLAGTINGCVLTVNANTLAGETQVNGCATTSSSVPEPGSFALLAAGSLLGAARLLRRLQPNS